MTDNIAAVCKTLLDLADVSAGELQDYLEFAAGFIQLFENEADEALDVFLEDRKGFDLVVKLKTRMEGML